MVNGNWETRVELSVPVDDDQGGQTNETRFAYAPYMGGLALAPGPKVRLKYIHRNCS